MSLATKINYYSIFIILVLAFCLRFWGTFDHPQYFKDEVLHVPSALDYGQLGIIKSDDRLHPLLSHLLLYGSIKFFGDNSYGWRMRNVILGTLTVAITFLVACQLFPGTNVPLIAASLLAVDPFHIFYSRTTFMEIPVSCFFLMFLLFILMFLRTGRDYLIPAGLCLGMTIATKGYYPFAILFVFGLVTYQLWKLQETKPAQWVYLTATLLLLPATVYLLTYLPWLGNGHTFPELLQMKQDSYEMLRSLTLETFDNIKMLSAGGLPWEWYIKPTSFGLSISDDGIWGRFLLEINNPPILMTTLPALLVSLWLAWRQRRWQLLTIPAIFLSSYLLFFVVKRPMFSYSALVLLPFAYLMIAFCIDGMLSRFRNNQRLFRITITTIILWGLYLFPLSSGQLVPVLLYKPVLSLTEFQPTNIDPAATDKNRR